MTKFSLICSTMRMIRTMKRRFWQLNVPNLKYWYFVLSILWVLKCHLFHRKVLWRFLLLHRPWNVVSFIILISVKTYLLPGCNTIDMLISLKCISTRKILFSSSESYICLPWISNSHLKYNKKRPLILSSCLNLFLSWSSYFSKWDIKWQVAQASNIGVILDTSLSPHHLIHQQVSAILVPKYSS